MWFLKVYFQKTESQIIIDYRIQENLNKHIIVAFENLQQAFQNLMYSNEIKCQYHDLFSKIQISQNNVKHIIDAYSWEEIEINTLSEDSNKTAYNYLFQQIISFFQQDLLICSYNFDKIIRYKYKNTFCYSFMIFPGLIQSDDSSQRSVNLQDKLEKMIRQQIHHKTNKRLEILTFMKAFVILKNERFFYQIIKNFDNEIEFLAKENILLEIKNEYIEFQLGYDTSKKQNYDENFQKYRDFLLSFKFQLDKQIWDSKLFEQISPLLIQTIQFLKIDRIEMQEKKQQNQNFNTQKECEKKLELAFNQFYDMNYENEEILEQNFKKLEEAIQNLQDKVEQQNLDISVKEEKQKYFVQLREDMKQYKNQIITYQNKKIN
ncbi:hypothetical protein ABPG72_017973 [Tetrahymena utriculariae]